MKYLTLFLALVACGKSEKSEPAPSQTANPTGAKPADKPQVDPGKKQRLCKRIDTDVIARAIELPGGLSRTGNGVLVKGGSEPASLVCSYYEKGKMDGGMSFGFGIKATTELDKKDFLGRFKWEPFDGLGQEAMIGRGKDGVHVQTIAKGVQLVVDVKQPGMPTADLEKRAVAAAKVMIEQLPADATAELR